MIVGRAWKQTLNICKSFRKQNSWKTQIHCKCIFEISNNNKIYLALFRYKTEWFFQFPGKTFIGHQISRVLLANDRLWNPLRRRPMLVVCFTNHALDQFLSGIFKFMESESRCDLDCHDMIRVGSRSKDETLKKFLLGDVKKRTNVSLPREFSHRLKNAYHQRKLVGSILQQKSGNLKTLRIKVHKFITARNSFRLFLFEVYWWLRRMVVISFLMNMNSNGRSILDTGLR